MRFVGIAAVMTLICVLLQRLFRISWNCARARSLALSAILKTFLGGAVVCGARRGRSGIRGTRHDVLHRRVDEGCLGCACALA